ncbi:hypothetical protein SLA2020_101150 [Shorea laevis]
MALLGKWWWKLANLEDSLWRRVIKERYGRKDENWVKWVTEGGGRGSIWWRDLCKLDRTTGDTNGWLTGNFHLALGEGNSIKFWTDN